MSARIGLGISRNVAAATAVKMALSRRVDFTTKLGFSATKNT